MKIVSTEDLDIDSVLEYFSDVVVVPTETVYGLAADIYNPHAVGRIFELKNRPADNPLIVHVSSIEMLNSIIEGPIPEEYTRIMDKFWPGPISLLFKAKDCVNPVVRGGLDTLVVRMPNNKCLLDIIERLGVPIAAPSANISGSPSPTTIQHVKDDFGGKIGLMIDGGPCSVGVESTVVSFIDNKVTVLRPGGVTVSEMEDTLKSEVKMGCNDGGKALSPGQKYRHYCPETPLVLFKGRDLHLKNLIYNYIEKNPRFSRFGIVTHSGVTLEPPEGKLFVFFDMGHGKKEICRNLFGGLRELDGECEAILVLGTDYEDEGLTIMDRLERAASEIITT